MRPQTIVFRSMAQKICAMKPELPIKAIVCFDAVMRTGCLTTAAEQLFVTPGAVGQQIRKLEAWLGVALFVRGVRKLHPTPDATGYWETVQPALHRIGEASFGLRSKGDQEVRLSLPPTFGSTWFSRRMPLLTAQDPLLRLHVNAGDEVVDLGRGAYDLAVRHFGGQGAGLTAELLLPDEVRVYGSPQYGAQLGLLAVADIVRATLLYTTSHVHWRDWLAQVDVPYTTIASKLRFDQSTMAIDAARRHQGLVLTSPWLVEDDLAEGQLVQLFEPALQVVGKGYYLVHRRDVPLRAPAQRLRHWLFESARQCLKDSAGPPSGP